MNMNIKEEENLFRFRSFFKTYETSKSFQNCLKSPKMPKLPKLVKMLLPWGEEVDLVVAWLEVLLPGI